MSELQGLGTVPALKKGGKPKLQMKTSADDLMQGKHWTVMSLDVTREIKRFKKTS